MLVRASHVMILIASKGVITVIGVITIVQYSLSIVHVLIAWDVRKTGRGRADYPALACKKNRFVRYVHVMHRTWGDENENPLQHDIFYFLNKSPPRV